ncbi:MAG TPA: proteasome accessory factor PafA2 family protein [Fimbriimonadaceae bacterium]|jgi:proteasome accessory factor A
MLKILAGIETEYGLFIEGRGAEEQVDDATAFVRAYPGPHFAGWDYRYESPRADLRGFSVSRLQVDPIDAKFDSGVFRSSDPDIRSDRVLPNGARFYNDHGHPEYSTPECWGTKELSVQDAAGEIVLLDTAKVMERETDRKVSVYKNNTDFHGASYGTHESYSMPRAVGFERIYGAVTPMLVSRQILTGAGKVGAEKGQSCAYQLSQRADFFVESFNTETLFRRPVFNTRDEAHADPRDWIRVHIISGDANMIPSCTARKVGLVKLALALEMTKEAPLWKLKNPVEAFQNISRDESYKFEVQLEGGSWTTAQEILESYFSAAEAVFGLRPGFDMGTPEAEAFDLIGECRQLLQDLTECPERFSRSVDWAAKKKMLEHFMAEEGSDWNDPSLRAFDLEYHNIDPAEGLYFALLEMDAVESSPSMETLQECLKQNREGTRAMARGMAVSKFKESVVSLSWRSIVFRDDNKDIEVLLEPDQVYPAQLDEAQDVGTFIKWIQEISSSKAKID